MTPLCGRGLRQAWRAATVRSASQYAYQVQVETGEQSEK
jgi:hypothetical protein